MSVPVFFDLSGSLSQSIKFDRIDGSSLTNNNKSLYLFATHNSIEQLNFDPHKSNYDFNRTYPSIISICEDIYVLGHIHQGNFFIYDNNKKQLIKYNVENKKSINLKPIPIKESDKFLMYHRESPSSSFIYSFGGVKLGNFKYSIEHNRWEQFFKDDKFERDWCPSTPIIF
ncbi:hypothetical protein PPL_08234 [Heterostelium album PN500]|uniref:Uncharacterized protein n=1 Tax=Heterostelium pallidum (strain ATCC 26659 / Pp 5 / PN500) TaxID=670386 RepID=D3BIZ9_HETP5|nr:hypothetical protein PPL_08234 [Heterostelium album PN500]EFA78773.1 hypothetical protein PPL_08234 [Heterostelium album PN500]|eukprot:XP_020430897.1 hypothetical protein PPL_08234 [Heterostelium album PN500]